MCYPDLFLAVFTQCQYNYLEKGDFTYQMRGVGKYTLYFHSIISPLIR